MTRLQATYDIESPVGIARAAEVLAGEQSTGTFMRLASETDSLRDRSAARVEAVEITGSADHPALPCRLTSESYEQGRITISWPVDNFGPSLPNILATIAGNLFELAEVSAIRLVALDVPDAIAQSLPGPQFGVAGTRKLMSVPKGPMIGTIIKPSVGLSAEETALLAGDLALAGIDFIKDDELQANGPACPLDQRVSLVMDALDNAAQTTGRKAMYAFNITDEITQMWRHLEMLEKRGATSAMVSLNSIGLAGLRAVRDQSPLPIHAHRNGWGLMSRSPHIGVAYSVMQKLWRMAGADHLHVNGLASKFTEPNEVVKDAALAVQAPVSDNVDHAAVPVFSSGQTAWQVGPSMAFLGNDDFLFCAGGGIMSHPGGPAAGITSLRQAAEAQTIGKDVTDHAKDCPELAAALDTFKGAVNRG